MYDYHTHTNFSEDCRVSMDDMIRAAAAKNFKEIAVTDHYDPDYPNPDWTFDLDFDSYHQALLKAENDYSDHIKVIKGIEIGIQDGSTLKKCINAAGAFPYDFILASFHAFDGMDICIADYEKIGHNKALYLFYSYMHKCLLKFNDYDVLGHINVIDRYLGREPDYSSCMEVVETILRTIIYKGKGIEINTSSYRYGLGSRTHPTAEILKLYKTLGGEILTIGSDAHFTKDIGSSFHLAKEIAEKHGFRYIACYRQRKPEMIPIF